MKRLILAAAVLIFLGLSFFGAWVITMDSRDKRVKNYERKIEILRDSIIILKEGLNETDS